MAFEKEGEEYEVDIPDVTKDPPKIYRCKDCGLMDTNAWVLCNPEEVSDG